MVMGRESHFIASNAWKSGINRGLRLALNTHTHTHKALHNNTNALEC